METINIVNFSGGKDSTAMLLKMIEMCYKIDDIIFCDTGMEFDEVYKHIKLIENKIGRKITILKNSKGLWDYWFFEHIKTKGKCIGDKGYGFPLTMGFRWCNKHLKREPFIKYIKQKYKDYKVNSFIGFSLEETKRAIDC